MGTKKPAHHAPFFSSGEAFDSLQLAKKQEAGNNALTQATFCSGRVDGMIKQLEDVVDDPAQSGAANDLLSRASEMLELQGRFQAQAALMFH